MDPLGFALERFDVIGRWRALDEVGKQIDTSSELPDGRKFEGVEGLRNLLLNEPDQFVRTTTQRLLVYALGRPIESYNMAAVRKIVRDAAPAEYRWSSLILGVVRSVPFQMRKSMS